VRSSAPFPAPYLLPGFTDFRRESNVATVRVRNVELFYEIAGAGPPVLFISGTGGDLRQRPSVFDGPLVEHCTVLAYDQRGLGRSSKPDRPSTMADYADDAARLLEAVGWTRAAVIGVSFGGMVAQELAIRHPASAGALVLCCTSSGGAGGSSYPLHELEELDEDERRRTTLALSDRRYDHEWQQANPDEAEALLAFMRESVRAGRPGRRPPPTRIPPWPRHLGPTRPDQCADPRLRRPL